MEGLPADLCLKIFRLLDYQSLASSQQVCRNWRTLASEDTLWLELFEERWGGERAAFYAPAGSRSWKDVYEVQDRCDRVGLGLKIIREGRDYYLIHQGEIQRHLGSRRPGKGASKRTQRSGAEEEGGQLGILDKILFFVGDMEKAAGDAERGRF